MIPFAHFSTREYHIGFQENSAEGCLHFDTGADYPVNAPVLDCVGDDSPRLKPGASQMRVI
jgi:hypothetical protein